jgi:hypothetical protein
VKTTVSVLFPLGHEILDWAINPRFLGEAETNFPPGWRSWDRTGVLESGQFVFDWETPHIAMYAAFILLRLQDLAKDARDKYAETAKNLEKRIRGALKFQRTSGLQIRGCLGRTTRFERFLFSGECSNNFGELLQYVNGHWKRGYSACFLSLHRPLARDLGRCFAGSARC